MDSIVVVVIGKDANKRGVNSLSPPKYIVEITEKGGKYSE